MADAVGACALVLAAAAHEDADRRRGHVRKPENDHAHAVVERRDRSVRIACVGHWLTVTDCRSGGSIGGPADTNSNPTGAGGQDYHASKRPGRQGWRGSRRLTTPARNA